MTLHSVVRAIACMNETQGQLESVALLVTDPLCQEENCVSVAGLLYHPNDQHTLAVIDDPKR